jgi:hypothetical protein
MVTRIEQGKGYENPYVKLSPQALTILRMPARSIGYSPVATRRVRSNPTSCTPPAVQPARLASQ